MTNHDLQIIGNNIHLQGFIVGTVSDTVPTSIRNRFIDMLEDVKPERADYTGKVR
jgi:hypothetical protein